MPSLTDIQIVTVAYNSTAVIGDMLASVPEGVQVVIVDNASTDAGALAALAAQHGATVVTNPENKGFGAACNIGAAHCDRPWLMFLNPDARLEPGCLDTLCTAADAHPTACAFTPRVLDGKGKQAFRRRSRLLPKTKHWTGPAPEQDIEVPLLNGAAIFVKTSNFNDVSGFDDRIFLYHEDDDISLRLSAAHGPIRFVHDAVVTHAEGRSTARTPETAAFKAKHMAQSAIYAMEKHGQPGARPRIIAHGLMQLISPINLASARKRAKALGFLKGALSKGITPPS
ncbi:glycosyltransferase family 2 protein [Tateyamaria sp. ANG-S1]|uniref:glycosyltransferase family 2 protein n=1 Tax=Tateyamaria sp. ANG-S1 TaxID=1577905 RepID=UPI000580A8DB|nr:glycosyltransferase family 2 protein [Tateyamaria sp. ANG-S1]KIC49954.1 glycosyl transferase [Tateyamaria sp. ANG-S1]